LELQRRFLEEEADQRHILRDRRPSLLGDGDKGTEIVYGEEKNILYLADYRAAKAEQKSLVPARSFSFVLFESPFNSVSTVSRGHPSPASLRQMVGGPSHV
jgi:hypothetical protein